MGTETMHSPIPPALDTDLRKMRRNPADFAVASVNKCKFCLKPKTAYHLINAKFGTRIVGSWCLTHGWLFFDSVELPPTERLKPTEIEEIRLTEQRRKEFARRKATEGTDLYRKHVEKYYEGWNSNGFSHWMPLPDPPKEQS